MELETLKLLVDNNYSTREIAKELSCSQTNVRHWLKKFGLSTSPKNKEKSKALECTWHLCDLPSSGKFCSKKCKNKYYVQKRRWQCKIKAVEYKGEKCEYCGYDKCIDAFDFHHLEPNEKDFGIGSGNTYAWDTIKAELDKCVMLCANCHREEHYKLKPKWN
jgi:hypothetical protein